MKQIVNSILLLVIWASAFAQEKDIDQFSWMLGEWRGAQGQAGLYEKWDKIDEFLMLGEGYYIVNGDTVIREILRIQKIGRFWTYIPIINKGKPVMFTLIESEPGVWIFENKEHDFPQRVVYSQKTDGSLFAWIEGEQKGQFMKDEYAMQKVN